MPATCSPTGAAPPGRLRVSVPLTLGRKMWCLRAEFLPKYPELSVEVAFSDRRVNLIEVGVDVALRIGEPSDSSLIAPASQRNLPARTRAFVGFIAALPDVRRSDA